MTQIFSATYKNSNFELNRILAISQLSDSLCLNIEVKSILFDQSIKQSINHFISMMPNNVVHPNVPVDVSHFNA